MSIERINAITQELMDVFAEMQVSAARAYPLINELADLGVALPPELRAMVNSLQIN
jgi:hypothetical protein